LEVKVLLSLKTTAYGRVATHVLFTDYFQMAKVLAALCYDQFVAIIKNDICVSKYYWVMYITVFWMNSGYWHLNGSEQTNPK
jgi:hypothetical protein